MKYINILTITTFLMGCASLSEVKERDIVIAELNEQTHRDSIIIDSLKNCTNDFKVEAYRYKNASDSRDQWFKEFSMCKQLNDSLFLKQTELEEELEKCQK